MAGVYGGFTSSAEFIDGAQRFHPISYCLRIPKTLIFAMLLATIPSFHGYYMKGGALEVGKASTVAFVWTSVSIILFNYILTQLLLGS
jgi:phospholipid/cholesterol/gamma-HCH transport system permease protein